MRVLITCIVTMCLIAVATAAPISAAPDRANGNGQGRNLGRQTLGANNGWAAFGTNNLGQAGTTGGASADDEHVYVVSTWQEFREALGGTAARGDTTPRIIYVQGEINANVDGDGNLLTCDDYARDTGYSLEAYLEAYDPATWGMENEVEGPLEDARALAAANQAAQIRQYVGSNVTIIGLGDDARLVGANIVVRGIDEEHPADNVIIRNIEFSDAYDCFPQWDPTDGDTGNWNSAYDNLWIANATHVWIDHNTFNDGEHPGSALPTYFGRKFEVHDGLLDITNAADLVTVSYNVFENHDKTMLIGSSNNPRIPDRGKLRVTIHHNLFDNILQRAPRLRFGQVHVYNNCYRQPSAEGYSYSWGVGVESQIYAENNAFEIHGLDPATIIRDWGGTMIFERGTLVNGEAMSLLAAYNAAHDPDLTGSVEWTPTLYERIDPTQSVCPRVDAQAGAGKLAMPQSEPNVWALTAGNRLLTFNESRPDRILSRLDITGLEAGEQLLGIDVRPVDGLLYGVSNTSKIYLINTMTGAAIRMGAQLEPRLNYNIAIGIDFNPAADRLRIVTDKGQNLRVDVDTGVVADNDPGTDGIQPDESLAFAVGDRHAGVTPNVVAVAYGNNVASATTAQLYVIDSNLDILAAQNPPNAGTLNTKGAVRVNASNHAGFDIFTDEDGNNARAAIRLEGSNASGFYTVDLSSGHARLKSKGIIGGGEIIRDIAVASTPR